VCHTFFGRDDRSLATGRGLFGPRLVRVRYPPNLLGRGWSSTNRRAEATNEDYRKCLAKKPYHEF